MEKQCTKCKCIKSISEYYWREKRQNYSASCKECFIKESINYNKKNKDSRKLYYDEWRSNNEKQKIYQREYKRKASPQQRVIFNLRNRVYKLLLKEYQGQQTLDLIGCTREEFITHIENQFKPEMNWDNYGTYWELDHIVPLSKGGTIRWDNSQPLTISENRIKHNK
jgi:5-methylcytosine-specific restriction endonuclease McrA